MRVSRGHLSSGEGCCPAPRQQPGHRRPFAAPFLHPLASPKPFSLQVEEKAKFDGIFESLLPVKGLLSGDKVKPVLMNSKLPLDVLGRVSGCGWARQ